MIKITEFSASVTINPEFIKESSICKSFEGLKSGEFVEEMILIPN